MRGRSPYVFGALCIHHEQLRAVEESGSLLPTLRLAEVLLFHALQKDVLDMETQERHVGDDTEVG